MKPTQRKLLPLAAITGIALALAATQSQAATVIASTDFNGRTVSGNTASNLNWTINGVLDPGDMTATYAGTPTLFNSQALTRNMFAPAWNYGNNGGNWTTNVSITVAPGFNVTIEDVTFDYWALSGGEAQNVNRVADFNVTLFNPSSVAVGGIFTVNDILNGTPATPGVGSPVTATFTPVALTEIGTYTLRIEGGEFGGINETGNHAGIDNLSINGTVSVIPEPSAALLGGLGLLALLRRRR